MSSCDYCRVPFLSKTPRYIRRIPAHRLEDGEYNVKEDYWYDLFYGLRRTLTLETLDGRMIYIRLPVSCKIPRTALVGGSLFKGTLKPQISPHCYEEIHTLDESLRNKIFVTKFLNRKRNKFSI
jgi:hypothetical protein